MNDQAPAYGLWLLVMINSAVFILFAFSFFKPKTGRDWRSFGAFSGFLVALFTEMYGFPLTIYLLSGWLQSRYPGVDWFAHDAGHLPEMLFGWKANPHFGPFHLLSFAFIGGGFILIAAAWRVLYEAQRRGVVATSGPYAHVRHPQYAGFMLIMLGFLLQWPTVLTLGMFPVLVWMYLRLARQEEAEALAAFGEDYARYAARAPRFAPRLTRFIGRAARAAKDDEDPPPSSRAVPTGGPGAVAPASGKQEEDPPMNRNLPTFMLAVAAIIALGTVAPASANQHVARGPGVEGMMLGIPQMDPARGRKLFASKGCVVCHSVNGVGGEDAPALDVSAMQQFMNPFEFAAKMWRGAEAMIILQREELGEQIDFTGGELADITAFAHHPEEQKRFSEADIPPRIRALLKHLKEAETQEEKGEQGDDKSAK